MKAKLEVHKHPNSEHPLFTFEAKIYNELATCYGYGATEEEAVEDVKRNFLNQQFELVREEEIEI